MLYEGNLKKHLKPDGLQLRYLLDTKQPVVGTCPPLEELESLSPWATVWLFIGGEILVTCVSVASLYKALPETTFELLPVQALSNEDHLAAFLFTLRPRLLGRAREGHVHSLENKFLCHSLNSEHTFRPEDVGALFPQKPPNPFVQLGLINLALHVHAYRAHTVVVHVLLVIIQETILHLHDLVKIKCPNSHDVVHVDATVLASSNLDILIDHADPLLYLIKRRLIN
mmetsp:Transcript_28069/g.48930  ORF Transcript_28069/g.48930 Transcript_28069/m.48930 type:complete len:227 (-) Transcript_28069:278-958(-)